MLRAIVGIEIELSSLVGKWKVSQNRSAADREGVAAGLAALATQGNDAQAAAMAAEVASRRRPEATAQPHLARHLQAPISRQAARQEHAMNESPAAATLPSIAAADLGYEPENTYGGVLSFMRRRYTRDLAASTSP